MTASERASVCEEAGRSLRKSEGLGIWGAQEGEDLSLRFRVYFLRSLDSLFGGFMGGAGREE